MQIERLVHVREKPPLNDDNNLRNGTGGRENKCDQVEKQISIFEYELERQSERQNDAHIGNGVCGA